MRTILGAGHVVRIVALEDVSVLRTEPVLAGPAVLQIAQTHTDLLIGPTVAQFWQTLLWLWLSQVQNLVLRIDQQVVSTRIALYLVVDWFPDFRWRQLDNAWY